MKDERLAGFNATVTHNQEVIATSFFKVKSKVTLRDIDEFDNEEKKVKVKISKWAREQTQGLFPIQAWKHWELWTDGQLQRKSVYNNVKIIVTAEWKPESI